MRWSYTLALYGSYFACVAFLISVELTLITYFGMAPLSTVIAAIAAVLFFVPACFKNFIDNNIAAYPVLWIYPWQKLYPYSFTAGTWLGFPFDQIWDMVRLSTEARMHRTLFFYLQDKQLHAYRIHVCMWLC